MNELTVVLAEDSVLLRDGLVRLLERAKIEVLATCADGDHLVELTAQHQPGIVIADVRMPPTHTSEGVQAALKIREHNPGQPVLVLSQYVEENYATDLLVEPAGLGYLLKDRVVETAEFLKSVREVASGGTVLDPDVVRQLMTRSRQANPLSGLTPREREVLELMAQGCDNARIAEKCFVSSSSVEKYIASIFSKLDLPPQDGQHRRVLAVLQWLNHGRK